MPWTGELYAESHDQRSLYRIYFIEARPRWTATTDTVLGCGGSSKPVIAQDSDHSKQTVAIRDAMHSGINWCINRPSKWRKWDEP
ncbi:Uncharacterised protein [Mycobacteroides abscessus subsp. abscessus]|nr:Uncharacterised protein [Mycobacteroides abscessus subsp. abscessus]